MTFLAPVLGTAHILRNFSQRLSKVCIIIPILQIREQLHNFSLDHTQILDGRAETAIAPNFIINKICIKCLLGILSHPLPPPPPPKNKPFVLLNHTISNQSAKKFLSSSVRTLRSYYIQGKGHAVLGTETRNCSSSTGSKCCNSPQAPNN